MMLDREKLGSLLSDADLTHWRNLLEPLIDAKLAPQSNGNIPGWLAVLGGLPELQPGKASLDEPVVRVDLPDSDVLEGALKLLSPWRKGPFALGAVHIDTEWRSDLKWERLQQRISPLAGRRVLDVGCGNGYYGYRMLGDGATSVIGVDPTILFVAQFAALSRYLPSDRLTVLPLRLEELPCAERSFDTAFSMGVLYHQRSPLDHLRNLRMHLRGGGELVLETIVLPGDEALARTPPGRYARMRNVWMLPTVAELETWLLRTGFRDPELIDVTLTTPVEQRPTEWMTFESLEHALDPSNPERTVEGWPAPHRAILTALAP